VNTHASGPPAGTDVPAANAVRIARMRERLSQAFAPVALEVFDDSHKHVGPAGARDGRGHFTVEIVSDAFAGLSPLARHRAVYAALGGMMDNDIHALVIRAREPVEAD
jgi:BolA protein